MGPEHTSIAADLAIPVDSAGVPKIGIGDLSVKLGAKPAILHGSSPPLQWLARRFHNLIVRFLQANLEERVREAIDYTNDTLADKFQPPPRLGDAPGANVYQSERLKKQGEYVSQEFQRKDCKGGSKTTDGKCTFSLPQLLDFFKYCGLDLRASDVFEIFGSLPATEDHHVPAEEFLYLFA